MYFDDQNLDSPFFRVIYVIDGNMIFYGDSFSGVKCQKSQFVRKYHFKLMNENKKNEIIKKLNKKLQTPTEIQKKRALFLAQVVRNAMEDFHVENLSDSQMKALNPIIRNGILTGLHMLDNASHPKVSLPFGFIHMSIPEYWEDPEFEDDYAQVLKKSDSLYEDYKTIQKQK